MGSKAKRIQKKLNAAKSGAAKAQAVAEAKRRIQEYKAAGQYEKALEEIIALFEQDYMPVELMYETADIYYAVGDYERSAVWARKALNLDKTNARGQLLLAKVCAMREQFADSFAALERAVSGNAALSNDDRQEMEDIFEYFAGDCDGQYVGDNYPKLYPVWMEWAATAAPLPLEAEPCGVAEEADEPGGAAAAQRPAEALPEEPAANGAAVDSADDEFAPLRDKTGEEAAGWIMAKDVSLLEKIDLCQQLALRYYTDGDMFKAAAVLRQVLVIDGHNEQALKNIGVILAELGQKDAALDILGRIKSVDFLVLREMQRLAKG